MKIYSSKKSDNFPAKKFCKKASNYELFVNYFL